MQGVVYLYCSKCNEKVENGKNFCSNCGSNVFQENQGQQSIQLTPQATKKKKRTIWIISIIAILVLLTIGGGVVYYTNTNTNKLIGTWKGTNNIGDPVTLSFKENGSVIFIHEDGTTSTGKYSLDSKRNPNWLDINSIIDGDETKKDIKIKCVGIVRFIDNDKMEYIYRQMKSELIDIRPTSFDENETKRKNVGLTFIDKLTKYEYSGLK